MEAEVGPPSPDLDALTFAETAATLWRLRLLLLAGPSLMGASIARAGRPRAALAWTAVSMTATLAGLLAGRCGRRRPERFRCRQAFTVLSGLSAGVWGSASFLIDPSTPAAAIGRIVPAIAVLAMVSVLFSAYRPSFLAGVAGVCGPYGVSLLFVDQRLMVEAIPAFVTVAAVFVLQGLWSGQRNRQALADRWRTREQAEGLRRDRAAALATNVQLRAVNEHVRRLAERDELTGAFNRRVLVDRMAATPASERARHVLALIDLDHFKATNDAFGHAMGDEILCHLVGAAHALLSEPACLARWGGEEFALLLRDVDLPDALRLIDELREAMRARLPAGVVSTFSAGVAAWERDLAPAELLRHADTALYSAKARGRNRSEAHVVDPASLSVPPG